MSASPAQTPLIRAAASVLVLFLGAVLGTRAGLGSLVRPLFPIASMLLAGWLLAKQRRENYVAFCFWLFVLTPGLRRFVDYSTGWSQANALMLAPYASAILSAIPVAKASMARRFAYSGPFAVLFACTAYGLGVAIIERRLFAGAFECLRWVVPPCFALFIALDPERHLAYRSTIVRTASLALIVLSFYGIYQFLFLPPWDAFWIVMSGLVTVGRPEPLNVHVFSSMNAPGALANYLMACILLTLSYRSIWRWPSIVAGVLSLLLTSARTGWIGLICGLAYMLVFGRSRAIRINLVQALLCIPIVLVAIQQIPEAQLSISTRLSSLNEAGNDFSFKERSNTYRDFWLHRLPSNLAGAGLGSSTPYQAYLERGQEERLDGQVMEIVTDLGIIAGGLYLLMFFVIALLACRISLGYADPIYTSCAALIVADSLWMLSGTSVVGEAGFILWIAIGVCLGRPPGAET